MWSPAGRPGLVMIRPGRHAGLLHGEEHLVGEHSRLDAEQAGFASGNLKRRRHSGTQLRPPPRFDAAVVDTVLAASTGPVHPNASGVEPARAATTAFSSSVACSRMSVA